MAARKPSRLSRRFFDRPTLDVARDLLGKVLVHRVRGREVSGAIVEVEAYIGESDPACHAAPGLTRRNEPLYGPPGHAYVYLNYGIHRLFNVVTEHEGSPAAVLVRALDPLQGLDLMRGRRGVSGTLREGPAALEANRGLCRGPGNLTRALGITLLHNRADLVRGDRLFVEDRGLKLGAISWGPRIGITKGLDRPWRAWIAGHGAVSRPGAARAEPTGPASLTSSKMSE